MINIFKELSNYNHYFENQLSLSATVLGLIVATSTFILQSGFSSFKYSRSMFLKYYVRQSQFIFLTLAYNILFSLIILYTNITSHILFFIHIIFGLVFTKQFLDFHSHKGYIVTINSRKFNPYKNRICKYFRYISNLGLLSNILIITTIYLLFIYPLYFNNLFQLNEYQVYMSTIACFAFSILILIKTIPQYFSFSELEYKSRTESEVEITDDKAFAYNKENQILKETLIKNGRIELKETRELGSFESIYITMPENKSVAFFVIHISFLNKDIYNIVESIEKYSYDFFLEINDINIDINTFVLSYLININEDLRNKSYYIKAQRTEIDNLKSRHSTPKSFIKNIDNKVIDELFRNV